MTRRQAGTHEPTSGWTQMDQADRGRRRQTVKTGPRVLHHSSTRTAGILARHHPRLCLPSHAVAQWRVESVVRLTAAGAAPEWRVVHRASPASRLTFRQKAGRHRTGCFKLFYNVSTTSIRHSTAIGQRRPVPWAARRIRWSAGYSQSKGGALKMRRRATSSLQRSHRVLRRQPGVLKMRCVISAGTSYASKKARADASPRVR